MRIAIPLDEDRKAVCAVFARAPYLMLYDTEEKKTEILENPAAQAESGAGLQAAQFTVDCQAEVLITPRLGENSAEVLKEAGIRIYKAEYKNAGENLDAFGEERLKPMEQFHAGFQGIR